MIKNFIFILLVGYAAARVMSDDNFSGPDFALSGELWVGLLTESKPPLPKKI